MNRCDLWLKLPTERRADAKVIFIRSDWRFAVEVFVQMKAPVQILRQFDPHIRRRLYSHASGSGQAGKQTEPRPNIDRRKSKSVEIDPSYGIGVRCLWFAQVSGITLPGTGSAAEQRQSRILRLQHVATEQSADRCS